MLNQLKRRYQRLTSDPRFSEIFTGSVWALGARVVSTFVAMITSIIVARVYGASAMGVLAVINSFLMFVTIFTVLGTGTSILRLIPEHMARYSVASAFRVYRKTQWFVAAVSLATGGIFYFAADIIADRLFMKPHLSGLFALAAVFVVFKSLMLLNTSAVRGLRLIRAFAFMQILSPIAMLLVLLGFTFLARHPDAPVFAQLMAYAITAIGGWCLVRWTFRKQMRPDGQVHDTPLRAIMAVSTPMLMTASMQFFIAQTGVVMLGIFRTEAEVGYYSIAVRLAGLTAFVIKAVNSMAAPSFSELYHAGKVDDLLHVARKSSKLIFWAVAPILVGLVLLGKPLIGLLYGDEFTVAYPAMIMLVAGKFVSSISGSTGMFMNMTGNEKMFRNIVTVASALIIGLGLILIPRFGIEGAAFAAMISLSFWNLATLAYIKRKFGRGIGYLPGIR